MRTSSNHCCGNEAGLVDKFIGSAYDVVKLVADNIEDLKGLYDLLNKYGMVVAVDDANKVAALPVLSKFARVYTYSKAQQRGVYTDYLYVPDNKSGIIPNDPKATGSWVIVYSSESGDGLETTYIPWVYNNGSAFGDETEIHVPDNTVGVPFIYINGSFQLVGYGYTYNPGTHVVTLSEPLNIKDEVVLMLSGLPAVPDNPNVSDFTIINWLYKNGSAVGGETVIHPPYTFQHVPAVFINGLRKVQPIDYTVNFDTHDINLKTSLKPGDTAVVQLGGELNTFQVDSSIGFEALSRTYAEVGMNLVKGSFEEGAVLTDSQDVLLQRSTGKVFNWQAVLPNDGKVIPAGSTPETTGGIGINKWQEVTSVTRYTQTQYSDGINYKTYYAWKEQVTLRYADEAVQFKQGGMFYRWDGTFPQEGFIIPQGTLEPAPNQLGAGKYVEVLDLGVRAELKISNFPASSGEIVFHPENCTVGYHSHPDVEMVGPGSYSVEGKEFRADQLRFNPAKTSLLYCPDAYARTTYGAFYPPPFLAGFERPAMTQVISAGSKLGDDTREVRRTVAYGPLIGSDPLDWNFVDAFGSNPLAYAGYVERTVSVGSESLVWFGAPNQEWLRKYQHDWWRKPAGNEFEPGQPGWDGGGLETKFPGIGNRIASFTSYSTKTGDSGYTTAVGRDSMGHTVQGIRNTALGYGAAGNLFSGSYNVNIGSLAGLDAVFSSYCTRVGDNAGRDSNDTSYATVLGYSAAREAQASDGLTAIGAFAAAGVKSAKGAVVIGNNAGRDSAVPLDGSLVIATGANPLISGKFADGNAGINVKPEDIRAKLHIRNAASGSALKHPGGVLTESPGTAFFVAETNSSGECQYRFADPESATAGAVAYSHASNSMKFVVEDAERLRAETNCFRPTVANTILCGRQAYPWSGGFTQTAFTVTSDSRLKTKPVSISDTVLDAWQEVEWCQYKLLDRIEAKGEVNARWHFGAIAQQIHAAFEKHGLDAFEFGLLCYDKWDEQPAIYRDLTDEELASGSYPLTQKQILVEPYVPAGDKWGVVYEEALVLEAALQRRKYQRLQERVEALEGR